jgi:hypothetical protein
MAESTFIVLPHTSTSEAIDTAQSFGGVFGKDCFLQSDNSLKIALDLIDDLIVQELRTPPAAPVAIPQEEPTRIDRTISMDMAQEIQLAQIEVDFLADWETAQGDRAAENAAFKKRAIAKKMLRSRVLTPLVQMELSPESNLAYGGFFDRATCLDWPDGKARTAHTLIHFSHPSSPEELWLREQRVNCRLILRYQIPGLDDAEWIRQNEPRQDLDCSGWRSLLWKRQD